MNKDNVRHSWTHVYQKEQPSFRKAYRGLRACCGLSVLRWPLPSTGHRLWNGILGSLEEALSSEGQRPCVWVDAYIHASHTR